VRRVGTRFRPCSDGELGHSLDQVKVVVRMGNYSAFNGYRFTPSDYSLVVCDACGTSWRTKADYVSVCPNGSFR
jgi:hypothetical protein